MKLHFWGRQWRFVLVKSLTFAWNIVIEDPFFVTCNYTLKKRVISLFRKNTCRYRYTIFFILLIKTIGIWNIMLAHFSYLFQVAAHCGLGCFEVKWELSSTFARMALHQFYLSILIDVWWASMPGFISQWRTAWTKLWKPVSDLVVSNDNLVINIRNFISYIFSIFVIRKLLQNYKSNVHFQFFYFWSVRS